MKRIILAILIIIWASIIFMFSHQAAEQSSNTSKGTIRIFLEEIVPKEFTESEKEEIINKTEHFVRKLAHYTIYTIGGILICTFISSFKTNEEKQILYSQVIGTMYAISDEIHQYFIPGRSCQLSDVLLDSIGVLTGILFVILIHKCGKKVLISKG